CGGSTFPGASLGAAKAAPNELGVRRGARGRAASRSEADRVEEVAVRRPEAASEGPARRIDPELALDEAERAELRAPRRLLGRGILAAAEAVRAAPAARIVRRPVVPHDRDDADRLPLLAVHAEREVHVVRAGRVSPRDGVHAQPGLLREVAE